MGQKVPEVHYQVTLGPSVLMVQHYLAKLVALVHFARVV